jgi:hypothetical protein
MSVHVVTNAHLDSLIATVLYGPLGCEEKVRQGFWHRLRLNDGRYKLDTPENGTVLGKMMQRANLVSYHALYEAKVSSEPVPDWQDCNYRFREASAKRLTVVQALKALESFTYQCSCAPEGTIYVIQTFVARFRDQLIRFLPGYDEAPWAIAD